MNCLTESTKSEFSIILDALHGSAERQGIYAAIIAVREAELVCDVNERIGIRRAIYEIELLLRQKVKAAEAPE